MTDIPTQASLDALFARATHVLVLDQGASTGKPGDAVLLAEARGAEIGVIREQLRIQEGGSTFHCLCLGDLAVELLAGNDHFATVSSHHARSLRLPTWSSDAMLVDGPALARWLASRGAPGPLHAFEHDMDLGRRAALARHLWLAAVPPCLLPDLPTFEEYTLGTDSKEYDLAEQRVRAAHATTELASAALLAWFGTGAGPWSGYPIYEQLPEVLLVRLGLPIARAAALSHAGDEAVLRGAARLFSSYPLVSQKKSEVGDVPEALWTTLRPVVEAMSHVGNLGIFDHAAAIAAEVRRLRARPVPVPLGASLMVVGISNNGPLSGLVTDETTLYAGEGGDIVMFKPGSTAPTVLLHGADPFFDLSLCDSQMLYLAHPSKGTISKVLTQVGRLIEVMRDQERPMGLVAGPGVIAWINQARVPDPERGPYFVAQRSSVMQLEFPSPLLVRAATGSAFSLSLDEEHMFWCELAGARLELWRAAHRPRGPAGYFAAVGERLAGSTWYPQLVVNATHVAWADPDRRAILGVDKHRGGEPVVLSETRYRPAHLVADDHDIFALTGDPSEQDWHVEHIPARSGASRVVADYRRQRWDRPGMVLSARALHFTTNDRILQLARA